MNLWAHGSLKKKKILYEYIKDDLNQILANIQREEEIWVNLWKKKDFFFSFWWFIMTKAEPIYLQFSGKENIFSDYSWRETLTELSCSPSPMSSVFSGRGIWGGFPAKWLQLFLQHQSDGVSAHVDFGFSLPLEPSSIRAFALRPGAQDKHSSFWVLNINIWWILLLISPGEKSKTLERVPFALWQSWCPCPTHRTLFLFIYSWKPEKIIMCANYASLWKYTFF